MMSSIIKSARKPQLLDDEQYYHNNQDGYDAALIRPCMVSYCFHSSIIPQEYGSGKDATINEMTATKPQLLDDEQYYHNNGSGKDATID